MLSFDKGKVGIITADTAISLLCGLPAPDMEKAEEEYILMFKAIPCRYPVELGNVDYNYVVDAEKHLLHIFRAVKYNTLEVYLYYILGSALRQIQEVY